MSRFDRFLLVAVFGGLFLINTGKCDWHYEPSNPQEWIDEYPVCGGVLQSPVNLQDQNCIYDSNLKEINFVDYDLNVFWNISNNGHTIYGQEITANNSPLPFITGSNYNEKFELKQFHFHWGPNSSLGSEHHIDQRIYPLEIHLVHFSPSNKIAVVSFLFELSQSKNRHLDPIISIIRKEIVENMWNSTNMALSDIFPDLQVANVNGYYRYLGSLTTPPCTEEVIWTVFRTKIPISSDQLSAFYDNTIKYNYRPVQNLNHRRLYFSQPDLGSGSINIRTNVFIFICLNLLAFFAKF